MNIPFFPFPGHSVSSPEQQIRNLACVHAYYMRGNAAYIRKEKKFPEVPASIFASLTRTDWKEMCFCYCLFNLIHCLEQKMILLRWKEKMHFGWQQAGSASEIHLSICGCGSGTLYQIFSLSFLLYQLLTTSLWVGGFIWILLRV